MVIVNHSAPAIKTPVDSSASGAGSVKNKTIALKCSDEVAHGRITEEVGQPADICHTVTATAGSSITSLGASVGTGSPWARSDSI